MQAIIYTRVSTGGQVDGLSLDVQEAKARQWCELHGCTVAAVYTDAGRSGKRADNRPELQRALRACAGGSVLVVYSLSRLARSVQDAAAIARRLDRAGADLVSVTEAFDTTSATGRLVFNMIAAIAQFESELIGDRVRDGKQHRKRQGMAYTSTPPFGFEHRAGRLVAVPAEQRTLRRIQQRRADGATLRAIAAELNDQGIASKAGGRWHPEKVRRAVARC